MTTHRMTLQDLRLLAGWLCLDFVNSIENPDGDAPEDFLTSYPDLALWAQHAGLIDDPTATRLIALAAADESQALITLDQALALRATMHRVFFAIAVGNHPEPVDLEHLKQAYANAMSNAILVSAEEHLAWAWPSGTPHLEQPLWPVTRSAIELLTRGDLQRIKVCENPYGCGWLFYDSSKNGSRRWCSMEGCGSQVKMRRQYAKRRGTAAV